MLCKKEQVCHLVTYVCVKFSFLCSEKSSPRHNPTASEAKIPIDFWFSDEAEAVFWKIDNTEAHLYPYKHLCGILYMRQFGP